MIMLLSTTRQQKFLRNAFPNSKNQGCYRWNYFHDLDKWVAVFYVSNDGFQMRVNGSQYLKGTSIACKS